MKKVIANIKTWIIDRITVKRILLFLLVTAIFIYIYYQVRLESTEAAIQIIGFAVTLFGALMIVVELRSSKKDKKIEYLVELNNYFHGNETLMKVYQMLEDDNNNKLGAENFTSLNVCDFAAFCSFYENIAFLIANGIASIGDVDDLFGYRFFSMMHCPYVQETLILPTSSSWQKIFELYELWLRYRKNLYRKGKYYGMKTIREENKYEDRYLREKMYMYDRGYTYDLIGNIFIDDKKIVFRTLTFPDITPMLEMQAESMPKELDSEGFYPLQRSEAIESMHKDYCVGAFYDTKLIAFMILIPDDGSNRNLSVATEQKQLIPQEVLTFDFVIVHPDYRRKGIQKAFINHSIEFAKSSNAKTILAATSKANIPSLNSFLSCGFSVLDPDVILYNGRHRILLKHDVDLS